MASIESDYDVLLKRRLEKIEQLKTTTIDYVKITKSFSDALKPLLDMQKKQDKSAKEQIKNQKTLKNLMKSSTKFTNLKSSKN